MGFSYTFLLHLLKEHWFTSYLQSVKENFSYFINYC